MFKRDWGIIFALGGCLAFSGIAAADVTCEIVGRSSECGEHDEQNRQGSYPSKYGDSKPNQVAQDRRTFDAETGPVTDEKAEREEREYPDDAQSKLQGTNTKIVEWLDLVAQAMMAVGTFGILYFTGRGLIFVKAAYDASKRTLRQAGRAAKYARQTLQQQRRTDYRQLRAVIDISETSCLVETIVKNGKRHFLCTYVFQIKNCGQTPTSGLSYSVRFEFYQGLLCPDHGTQPWPWSGGETRIFNLAPGNTREFSGVVEFDPAQVGIDALSESLHVVIHGHITYEDFEKRRYEYDFLVEDWPQGLRFDDHGKAVVRFGSPIDRNSTYRDKRTGIYQSPFS